MKANQPDQLHWEARGESGSRRPVGLRPLTQTPVRVSERKVSDGGSSKYSNKSTTVLSESGDSSVGLLVRKRRIPKCKREGRNKRTRKIGGRKEGDSVSQGVFQSQKV